MDTTFSVKQQVVKSGANTDDAGNVESPRLSLYDIEATAKSKQRPLLYTEREYGMIEQFIEFANDSTKYRWNELSTKRVDYPLGK